MKAMTTKAVSVLIVEDEPVFRQGLRSILEQAEDMSVLGDCSLSDGEVERIRDYQPRVVLLGTRPPRHLGLDICRRIGRHSPEVRVIVMSHEKDSGELFEAIRSGAWGYLSKLADAPTYLQAVREVGQGDMPVRHIMQVYPEVTQRLLEEFQTMARDPRWREITGLLSPREMEMLRQMGSGLNNKEIALALSITYQTVKNHITSILRKLDVNGRTQAVLVGLRRGWITLSEVPPNGANGVAS